MEYFTLGAHKKCIGQYNFDPLLYYDQTGNEKHSFYISDPGTYIIKYVSGAMLSFGYRTLNTLLYPSSQIKEDALYWNRYYPASTTVLGNYDITYFPTDQILLGAFQCPYGTLPGFTDRGYQTAELAIRVNTYLANNNDKYQFTDQLKFTIYEPETLIFWYNNINEQEVRGSMTFSLEREVESDTMFYLNDLSVLAIDKKTENKVIFENYSYNKHKSNFTEKHNKQLYNIWIKNLKAIETVTTIHDFNTIGYSSAYLNNITYSDTLNYNKKYSDDYHWELIQKTQSKFDFIGKFNIKSPDLLLYQGVYTIFLTGNNSDYTFSKKNLNELYTEADKTKHEILDFRTLESNSYYVFSVEQYNIIKFSKLLKDVKDELPVEVYLYKGELDIDELILYIANTKKNISFITTESESILQQYYTTEPHKTTELYNEIDYNYYLDASLYLENTGVLSFIVYSAASIKNALSIGPYKTADLASCAISDIFKLPLSAFKITKNEVINTSITYNVDLIEETI